MDDLERLEELKELIKGIKEDLLQEIERLPTNIRRPQIYNNYVDRFNTILEKTIDIILKIDPDYGREILDFNISPIEPIRIGGFIKIVAEDMLSNLKSKCTDLLSIINTIIRSKGYRKQINEITKNCEDRIKEYEVALQKLQSDLHKINNENAKLIKKNEKL